MRCPAIAVVPGAPGTARAVDARALAQRRRVGALHDDEVRADLADPDPADARRRAAGAAAASGPGTRSAGVRAQRGRARAARPASAPARSSLSRSSREPVLAQLRQQRRDRLLPGEREAGVGEHQQRRPRSGRSRRRAAHAPPLMALTVAARSPCRPSEPGPGVGQRPAHGDSGAARPLVRRRRRAARSRRRRRRQPPNRLHSSQRPEADVAAGDEQHRHPRAVERPEPERTRVGDDRGPGPAAGRSRTGRPPARAGSRTPGASSSSHACSAGTMSAAAYGFTNHATTATAARTSTIAPAVPGACGARSTPDSRGDERARDEPAQDERRGPR